MAIQKSSLHWHIWQISPVVQRAGKKQSSDGLTHEAIEVLQNCGKLPVEDLPEVKAVVINARAEGVIRKDSGSFPKRV